MISPTHRPSLNRRQCRQVGVRLGQLCVAITAGWTVVMGQVDLASRSVSLDRSAVAAEKSRIRWTPKKEQGNVKGTLSGGRRGQEASSCSPDADATRLSLLVPEGRDSLITTTEQPTFSWQIQTQKPTQMQFILSDVSQPTPVYTQALDVSANKLMSVTLPESVKLGAESKYRWMVIVDCPEGQKTEIFARSFIRKVSGESLEQQLNQKSAIAQAAVFAQNGYWYDAMARLLEAEPSDGENPDEALQALLEQAVPQAMLNEAETGSKL